MTNISVDPAPRTPNRASFMSKFTQLLDFVRGIIIPIPSVPITPTGILGSYSAKVFTITSRAGLTLLTLFTRTLKSHIVEVILKFTTPTLGASYLPALPRVLSPLADESPVRPYFTDGSIPVEICEQILCQLDTPSLLSCLRVSRYFHTISAYSVYPIIYGSLTIDLDREVNPLRTRDGVIESGWSAVRGLEDGDQESVMSMDPLHSGLSISPHIFTRPDGFGYNTHLNILTHGHSQCNLAPLYMPQLEALRIIPDKSTHYLYLCDMRPEHCCPLISGLRPRKVILGGTMTTLTGSVRGLWPSFPPPFVKELVVLVGMFAERSEPKDVHNSLFDSLPSTIEKLSLLTGCGSDGWCAFMEDEGEPDMLDDRAGHSLTRNVALACSGQAKMVELVGVQNDADYWVAGFDPDRDLEDAATVEGYMVYFREMLVERLVDKGWTFQEAIARADSVKEVNQAGFIKTNSWYLNPEGRWTDEEVVEFLSQQVGDVVIGGITARRSEGM